MAKKRLYAHILLDRSGSMGVNVPQTIGAINEYINGLKADPDISSRISLTLFDMPGASYPVSFNGQNIAPASPIDLTTIRNNVKAKECPALLPSEYSPRGGTPLNDAIGKVVEMIDRQTRREGENVALVIMTDGQENASKEFSKEAIKALLDDRKAKKNWLVIYLGADHDAFTASANYGISPQNTMQFNKLGIGNVNSMKSATRATMSYGLTGQAMAASFTDEEREKSMRK